MTYKWIILLRSSQEQRAPAKSCLCKTEVLAKEKQMTPGW